MPANFDSTDGSIDITPAKQEVRVARRGPRLALSAPTATAALTVEQVNGILQETREERNTAASTRRP